MDIPEHVGTSGDTNDEYARHEQYSHIPTHSHTHTTHHYDDHYIQVNLLTTIRLPSMIMMPLGMRSSF